MKYAETGLKYTNQEIICKNRKPVGIKLYVCDVNTMDINMKFTI